MPKTPVRVRGLGKNPVAFERYVAATDTSLLVLAILWLPVLIIPWITTLSQDLADTFTAIDFMVWAVFVVDYLIRLYLAPNRKHFFTHNLVDLVVVVVPFLRPLRALRIVRVFELGRVVAIGAEALRRARNILTHRGLHFVLLTVVVIMLVCSGLVLLFERNAHGSTIHNFPDALWWAMVTVTTVGYGDTYPVTAAGRGVAVVLMLTGIGLIGVLTATVASFSSSRIRARSATSWRRVSSASKASWPGPSRIRPSPSSRTGTSTGRSAKPARRRLRALPNEPSGEPDGPKKETRASRGR